MRTDIPRLVVTSNGAELPGLLDATVDLVAVRAASRFTLSFASQVLPAAALEDPELRLTLTDGRSRHPVLTGRPDSVTVDRIAGTTVVEGRDLAALFIDQALAETYANRTASEIATDLAGRHGLSAAVENTATPAGRLFNADYALLALASEWDLLCALADAEGFDLRVSGTTFAFGPPEPAASVTLRLSDCIALRQTTAPAVARAVELTIRSWDAAAAKPVVHTATRGKGAARRQHLSRPDLTPEAAERLAEHLLADLARFEHTATLTMPGETAIGVGSLVTVETQGYRVASLQRDWGPAGFVQTLSLVAAA